MNLSVIIPTLNASRTLSATLLAVGDIGEIVVVDGGSTDNTVELAKAHGARVVQGAAGRGQQLIAGVAVARNLSLALFDLAPGAKRALSRLSWGFGGDAPRLLRGLPVN